MRLPLGVEMNCTDGQCGRATHWIIDPLSFEMTHIVMQRPSNPPIQHLVPLEWIEASTSDGISLRCTMKEAMRLPLFGESETIELPTPFTKADTRCCCRECRSPNESPAYLTQLDMATWNRVYVHPFAVARRLYSEDLLSHLTHGEIAVQRGANVRAIDGRIGHVDEAVIDPFDHSVIHFVIREELSLIGLELVLPVTVIDRIFGHTVYLNLDKEAVEALPQIPITRV